MRRAWGILSVLTLSALWIPAAAAEHINVSRIVTGTQTSVNWSEINVLTRRGGATLSDYTLATAQIDPDKVVYFTPVPWGSVPTSTPGKPVISRVAPLADYQQNGFNFTYDRHYTSSAKVDMTPAGTKPVNASVFKGGAAMAAVSYRVQAVSTATDPVDYFVGLDVPLLLAGFQPAYNLCCSGDSNGGTYNYLRPHDATARAAVDIYVDDLPVWSSETAFIYPQTQDGSPFDRTDVAWDKPAVAGKTYLYLGPLAKGAGVVVTLVARAESAGTSDCGNQSFSFPSPPGDEKHCLDLFAQAPLAGGAGNSPAGFTLFWRAPKP